MLPTGPDSNFTWYFKAVPVKHPVETIGDSSEDIDRAAHEVLRYACSYRKSVGLKRQDRDATYAPTQEAANAFFEEAKRFLVKKDMPRSLAGFLNTELATKFYIGNAYVIFRAREFEKEYTEFLTKVMASVTAIANTTTKIETAANEAVVQFTVEPEWVDFLINYNDIFFHDYIGYWACGVQFRKGIGWLAYEQHDEMHPTYAQERAGLDAWDRDGELPEHFFAIDKAFAEKSYKKGVEKFGTNWYDRPESDANTYDYVVQTAALGDVVYG